MKLPYFFIFTFLFFLNYPIYAQSVSELIQQLTMSKTTDSAKVEAIYDWLTQHVSYDNDRRRHREGDTVLYQEPYNVVRFKKAVCMGYAKTFREMCRLSDIESYVIEGWAKSGSGTLDQEGHAWNVVKINDNWYLADATWDAGNTLQPKKYFLCPPSVFAQNHLPHDPMWQLLSAPISVDCFINKRHCNDTSSPNTFNFADTIRLWQKLDATQQAYNQSLRTVHFNPNDLMPIRELAEYYTLQAKNLFAEYSQIRKEITDKKQDNYPKTAVLNLLNTMTNYLKTAQSHYQTLVDKTKHSFQTDAHVNVQLIQETVNQIEEERKFVKRYLKD
jgi:hypothetical protein